MVVTEDGQIWASSELLIKEYLKKKKIKSGSPTRRHRVIYCLVNDLWTDKTAVPGSVVLLTVKPVVVLLTFSM